MIPGVKMRESLINAQHPNNTGDKIEVRRSIDLKYCPPEFAYLRDGPFIASLEYMAFAIRSEIAAD